MEDEPFRTRNVEAGRTRADATERASRRALDDGRRMPLDGPGAPVATDRGRRGR